MLGRPVCSLHSLPGLRDCLADPTALRVQGRWCDPQDRGGRGSRRSEPSPESRATAAAEPELAGIYLCPPPPLRLQDRVGLAGRQAQNPKYDTNELIFKTGRDTETQKTN